jgi:hypothetical protein
LLAVGAPIYGAQSIESSLSELWKLLKYEVYNGADDNLSISALVALKSMAYTLSTGPSTGGAGKETPLEAFLQLAVKELTRTLEDTELKQASQLAPLLEALASASEPSCFYLTVHCIPKLVDAIKSELVSAKRKKLLHMLNGFIASTRTIYGSVPAMAGKFMIKVSEKSCFWGILKM